MYSNIHHSPLPIHLIRHANSTAKRGNTITMVTTKTLESRIQGLAKDLKTAGFAPSKIMLFGSYVSGKANELSDIDVAVWAKGFSGTRVLDIEKIASIVSKYPMIEVHTFSSDDNSINPFTEEILKTGKDYTKYLN